MSLLCSHIGNPERDPEPPCPKLPTYRCLEQCRGRSIELKGFIDWENGMEEF
jgi:hypothetical protein